MGLRRGQVGLENIQTPPQKKSNLSRRQDKTWTDFVFNVTFVQNIVSLQIIQTNMVTMSRTSKSEKKWSLSQRGVQSFSPKKDGQKVLQINDGKNYTEALDEMSELLRKHVTNSLDECAPRKTFKVRNQHKFGITENTKKLIKESKQRLYMRPKALQKS